MFHFDFTTEDIRIILDRENNRGEYLVGTIYSLPADKSLDIKIHFNTLASVLALLVHMDCYPCSKEVAEAHYKEVQPWLDEYQMGIDEKNYDFRPVL